MPQSVKIVRKSAFGYDDDYDVENNYYHKASWCCDLYRRCSLILRYNSIGRRWFKTEPRELMPLTELILLMAQIMIMTITMTNPQPTYPQSCRFMFFSFLVVENKWKILKTQCVTAGGYTNASDRQKPSRQELPSQYWRRTGISKHW